MMIKKSQKFIFIWALVILILGVMFAWLSSRKTDVSEIRLLSEYENQALEIEIKDQEDFEKPDIFSLARQAAGFDQQKTYLLLFQNSAELRPTGGFVSSFGILKVKEGEVIDFQFFDTAVFDFQLSCPTQVEPPKPIKDYLSVKNWQFRDGNWSPDFPIAAKKMIEFYHLQCGRENFDGVIALVPKVLKSILELTGPVELPDYNLTLTSDNFLMEIQKQVEIEFWKQGISRKERKDILREIGEILIKRLTDLNPLKSLKLLNVGQEHLAKKDILLYFADEKLQEDILKLGWGGEIKKTRGDYLMVIDANMNAFKSDYYVKRDINYEIDLREEKPRARLKINYFHSATEKSWLTRDYRSWLRVYVPEGSWFKTASGLATDPEYGKEFGKTFIAGLVKIPLGSKHEVVLEYDLPEGFSKDSYQLLIQKQPGVSELPISLKIIYPDENIKTFKETIISDKEYVGL